MPDWKYPDSPIYKRHSVRAYSGASVTYEQTGHIMDLLRIPDTLFPFRVIAFGHPSAPFVPSDRYDESRVHHNSW